MITKKKQGEEAKKRIQDKAAQGTGEPTSPKRNKVASNLTLISSHEHPTMKLLLQAAAGPTGEEKVLLQSLEISN